MTLIKKGDHQFERKWATWKGQVRGKGGAGVRKEDWKQYNYILPKTIFKNLSVKLNLRLQSFRDIKFMLMN